MIYIFDTIALKMPGIIRENLWNYLKNSYGILKDSKIAKIIPEKSELEDSYTFISKLTTKLH